MSKEKEKKEKEKKWSDLPLIKRITSELSKKKKRNKRKKKLQKGRKSYKGVEYTGDLSERQKKEIDMLQKNK